MKRYIIFFVLPVLIILSGCFFYYSGVYGSGRLITNHYGYTGFFRIYASEGIEININYGEFYSISLLTDDNILPYISVENEESTLQVKMQSGFSYIDATVRVNVTMPILSSLELDNGSQAQISGFSLNDDLTVSLNDGSRGKLYLTEAEALNIEVKDRSSLEIHSVYSVDKLLISCSDNSTADLGEVNCHSGEISVDLRSFLKVNMDGPLKGQVSHGSTLYYRGSQVPGPILFSGSSGMVYY